MVAASASVVFSAYYMGATWSSFYNAASAPVEENQSGVIESVGTYYGPRFIFDTNGTPLPNSTPQMYFEDILNIIAGNHIRREDITLPQFPPAELRTTRTLEAKVNLTKNSIRVIKNEEGYNLSFNFDSSVSCMVNVIFLAKDTLQEIGPDEARYVYFDKNDKESNKVQFGPFNSKLAQTFSQNFNLDGHDESLMFNSEIVKSAPLQEPDAAQTSATLPKNSSELIELKRVPHPLFSLIIEIESTEHYPKNILSTFVKLCKIDSGIQASTCKQLILVTSSVTQIGSSSYLLQEIYGFSDNPSEANSPDCIICMSSAKDTIVLPCRHLCICGPCGELLRAPVSSNGRRTSPNTPSPKCPLCRQRKIL